MKKLCDVAFKRTGNSSLSKKILARRACKAVNEMGRMVLQQGIAARKFTTAVHRDMVLLRIDIPLKKVLQSGKCFSENEL